MRLVPTVLLMTTWLAGCDHVSISHYQGYVEGELLFVSSPAGGLLQQLFITRGEAIHAGKKLYQLDNQPEMMQIQEEQARLKEAKEQLADLIKPKRIQEIDAIIAQINQANAEMDLAKLRLARMEKLLKKQAVSKDEVDAAAANYIAKQQLVIQYQANLALAKLGGREDQIKAQSAIVKASEKKLRQVQWNLSQKTRYTQNNATVFDTYYLPNEWVPPQQPVLSLILPENLHVEFFVPEANLHDLKLGQEISFTCLGCKENQTAKINYISPEVEYMPPIVYSRNNQDKLVFRIKAAITSNPPPKMGQPVEITVKSHVNG